MHRSRYIVVEGPTGVGKSALAEKLAERLDARLVLEVHEANPFLSDFYVNKDRPALQAQLFFTLSRYRQFKDLSQLDLFQRTTVSDCLFERDRLYAMIHLDENEFALYEQIFNLLKDRLPTPDLVIYLSARTDVLCERLKERAGNEEPPDRERLEQLNEMYIRYFYHYDRAPLLVVNTSDVDILTDAENLRHLVRVIHEHRKGVKHYIPLNSRDDGAQSEA